MCGQEFCRACFSGSAVCPDCAENEGEDDDAEEAPDFDDVSNLNELLEDEDVEDVEEEEEDEIPEEDLRDDEAMYGDQDER